MYIQKKSRIDNFLPYSLTVNIRIMLFCIEIGPMYNLFFKN